MRLLKHPHPASPVLRVTRAEIDRLDLALLALLTLLARRAVPTRRPAPLKSFEGPDSRDQRREAGLLRRAVERDRERAGGRDG